MAELLEIQHLKTYFKTGGGMLHAVDDISFTLKEGQTLGVVGESGCGKSTLGRSILGLQSVTEGRVLFKGDDITALRGHARKKYISQMQMIFQDPFSSLNPHYCVFELIADPLKVYHLCHGREELRNRVKSLMDTVGLAERFMYSYPHELDGGRRQRIGIARALALEPKFIVCDEPVSALDVSIQSQVLNLMNQLKRDMNLTYIFVAHDLSVVEHISDRVGVMYLGNFVEEGDKYSLYQNPLHPYTQALLSAVPIPDPKAKKDRIILEGNIPSALNPPSGCKFHTRCPKCMERCKTEAPQKYQVDDDHFVYCHLYDTEEAKRNAKAAENAVIHQ